jgi:antagonist of KipI
MKILKKGILTTIQDMGRWSHQAAGVNPGGVMDTLSFRLLNIVLGNSENQAALEIHYPGPILEFEESCEFALSGADFLAKLNGMEVRRNKIQVAKKGDILTFSAKIEGERLYFGVKGGFLSNSWLGSKSYQSQLKVLALTHSLKLNETKNARSNNFGFSFHLELENPVIRFVSSFEYNEINDVFKNAMCETDFEITKHSNRMGYRLYGLAMSLDKPKEMISSGVSKGVIQLLPDGQLIILMADAQVSGGYPKLGFVIENDISKLSQLASGTKIRFQRIEYEKAIDVILQTSRSFELIRKSLRLREKNY